MAHGGYNGDKRITMVDAQGNSMWPYANVTVEFWTDVASNRDGIAALTNIDMSQSQDDVDAQIASALAFVLNTITGETFSASEVRKL